MRPLTPSFQVVTFAFLFCILIVLMVSTIPSQPNEVEVNGAINYGEAIDRHKSTSICQAARRSFAEVGTVITVAVYVHDLEHFEAVRFGWGHCKYALISNIQLNFLFYSDRLKGHFITLYYSHFEESNVTFQKIQHLLSWMIENFPNTDWFVLVDDQTLLVIERLVLELRQYPPTEFYYFGGIKQYGSFDNVNVTSSTTYAGLSEGVILSRGSVQALIHNKFNDCMSSIKAVPFNDRFALCLKSNNIEVKKLQGLYSQHPLDVFYHENTVKSMPISFHGLSPHEILVMSNRTRSIPKIVHQIMIGPLNSESKRISSCESIYRKAGFKYFLWNEENIRRFLSTAAHRTTFNTTQDSAQMSNILRYEILWHYGGLFIDAHVQCLRPATEVLDKITTDIFVCSEHRQSQQNLHIVDGIIGSTQYSETMFLAMFELVSRNLSNSNIFPNGDELIKSLMQQSKISTTILPRNICAHYFSFGLPPSECDPTN
jgi:hypothetical protein